LENLLLLLLLLLLFEVLLLLGSDAPGCCGAGNRCNTRDATTFCIGGHDWHASQTECLVNTS
jgi:hypothetical protein